MSFRIYVSSAQKVRRRGVGETISLFIYARDGGPTKDRSSWRTLHDFEEFNIKLTETFRVKGVGLPVPSSILLVSETARKNVAVELNRVYKQSLRNKAFRMVVLKFCGLMEGEQQMQQKLGHSEELVKVVDPTLKSKVRAILGKLTVRVVNGTLDIGLLLGEARKQIGFVVLVWVILGVIKRGWRNFALGHASGIVVGALFYERFLKQFIKVRSEQVFEIKEDVNMLVELFSPKERPDVKDGGVVVENKPEIEEVIKKLDELDSASAHQAAYDICMTEMDRARSNFELLWRVVRVVFATSEDLKRSEGETSARRIERLNQSLELAKGLLESFPEEYISHKWYAICAASDSGHRGTKQKMLGGFEFQKHTKIALELNPDDATLNYMLGRFNFEVAKLSWAERMGAKALFGQDPPSATFEEALQNFENACRLREGGAELGDLIEVARCQLKLKHKREAKVILEQIKNANALKDNDTEVIQEAKDMLKSM
uniref:Regulator of microtubule dynamics protein 1 n=1 Tax=Mucochytrium quahogii TaxID=96639 RepID=A0A7S2SEN6_9STRA|mmetsp:Transcript_17884/g.29005  ORF Transcript_17884/g.29005 Transcript_17884/m.29005 type:complete len:487 (+) Transcript_17884:264-1724(+)